MRVRIRVTATSLVALVICAATAIADVVRHTPAAGPDPVVREWAEWPHQVSCLGGGLPFDPVAAFSTPTNAESGRLPSERALRGVLASGELPRVRRHAWRHLSETRNSAEFAAGRLFTELRPGSVSELEWIKLRKIGGRWQLETFNAYCTPRSVRRGAFAAPWRLAFGEHLNRDTRRVRIEFESVTCDGRRSARLQKPEFREQNGHLLMTLWLGPVGRSGLPVCPLGIERPLLVELPEKLGARQLFDGGTYPPLAATRPVTGSG
jgi:hypothetical protein